MINDDNYIFKIDCDYCGKSFYTMDSFDRHDSICEKKREFIIVRNLRGKDDRKPFKEQKEFWEAKEKIDEAVDLATRAILKKDSVFSKKN